MTGSPVQRGGKHSADVAAYAFRRWWRESSCRPRSAVTRCLTSGDVMPGTTVAGVDVGGLSRTEARARIVHDLGDRLSAPVTVRVGDTTADVVPSELGIRLDADGDGRPARTARAASRPGCCRTSGRESIEPVLLYPKKLTLPKELATLEQKPRNAKPVVQDDGTVGVVPAEDGLVYDDAATLRAIAAGRAPAATARSR